MSFPASINPDGHPKPFFISEEKAFLISDVSPNDTTADAARKVSAISFAVPGVHNKGSQPDFELVQRAFKDARLHFTSLAFMSTFTTGVKFGFLFLAQDFTESSTSTSFQVSMMLSIIAASTDIIVVCMAARNASTASRCAILHLTSASPPPVEEYQRQYKRLDRSRVVCESLQSFGMLLFVPAVTALSWVMFTHCALAVLFNVFLWALAILFHVNGVNGALASGLATGGNTPAQFSSESHDEV
ncbi:hypothetical protein P691DRAFT_777626 [Macrolepiota fuliginosa MF-IS2]|uniref:Uncharacterized protein n=1 Tax=Macrolepiota fuliginosa MF-IS2 TaxID=1400762 RepID=A0A9P6C1G6_9AGAR|nr:hypothetical protein P691DRAFT_777626 [Macrolepiota fuliginosa MF-IS2]